MNKRQTRLFAIVSTALCAVAFLWMTFDSHRQFPKLTNAQNITPEVDRGNAVWHANNCINCHTLLGEGAYYAPDLTKITKHRGAAYLKAYIRDPSKFYDEARHRRLMPTQNLSDTDISDVVAFLDWVSNIDNQGWPPRPILVTGATIPGTAMSIAQQTAEASTNKPPGARPVSSDNDPIARGEKVFQTATPSCTACHSISPGVDMAGPSLAGISARAAQVIASPEYKGKAKDVAGFIHESIVDPSVYIHPGPMFSAEGVSFMPDTFGKDLTPEQIDDLVAYLSSFK